MKSLFKSLVILCGIITNFNLSASIKKTIEGKNLVWTLPKSGTNLILVILELLFDNQLEGIPPGGVRRQRKPVFFIKHFHAFNFFFENQTMLKSVFKKKKSIILIRDLRDRVCSIVDFIDKFKDPLRFQQTIDSLREECEIMHLELFEKRGNFESSRWRILTDSELYVIKEVWNSLSQEEKINHVIRTLKAISDQDLSIFESLNLYAQEGYFLIVKFENIVPVEGNGDINKLERELMKIADFLEISTTKEQIEDIPYKLWGHPRSWTFTPKEKKIGRWEDTFTLENLELFERELGDLNREMGYH